MRIVFFIFLILSSSIVSSKNLIFLNNTKLTVADLQAITSDNILQDSITDEIISNIIDDLYRSPLISDLELSYDQKSYYLSLTEAKIIENIYINGNIKIKDEIFLDLLQNKKNSLFDKNKLIEDLDLIKNIYLTKGFASPSVITLSEEYSKDRINLIIEIKEGEQSSISSIKFVGNKSFSSKFLLSKIKSEQLKFYNFFDRGSNLNSSLIENDINLLKDFYKKKGFQNVEVSFDIINTFSGYNLVFYINEHNRIKLDNINFYLEYTSKHKDKILSNLKSKLEKNSNYFDYDLIQEQIKKLNNDLIKNNFSNIVVKFKVDLDNDKYNLTLYEEKVEIKSIAKINIYGNTITKTNTILSKINLYPGEFYNPDSINEIKNKLIRYPYINNVDVNVTDENQRVNVDFEIDENKKTGSLLLAGTASGDTGLGIKLGADDKNLFGSGNSLKTSFSVNSEQLFFDIAYNQQPINNSSITNTYSISNQEIDYSSSFGFKTRLQKASYALSFDYDEYLSSSVGVSISRNNGHSPKNNSDAIITDNIGNFYNTIFRFSLTQDKTNNYLYPNDGYSNSFTIEYSPKDISDESYIKTMIRNDIYYKLNESENYFFLYNSLGIVNSFDGNLKSINAFSLGGLNFKGFDYRGIGEKNSNGIYIGGKKYFTTTIGYGSSFIFDEKDNVNIRFFYTNGSLWDNDYSKVDLKLRSSIGVSFDFLTAVGPISLTYSTPLNKESFDREQNFNFSIGSVF